MAFSVSVLMGIQLTLLVTKCLFAEVERVTSPGAGFCQC